MFDALSDKLGAALGDLRSRGTLDEEAISQRDARDPPRAARGRRQPKVVRDFVARVRERALGEEVLKSLTPGQQVVKVVNEELTELLGSSTTAARAAGRRAVILLAGLQGSGKTTAAAKLARHLRKRGQASPASSPPTSSVRPRSTSSSSSAGRSACPSTAAIRSDPVEATREGLERAREDGIDAVIVDTAGRLQIDEALMDELVARPRRGQADQRRCSCSTR